MVLGNLGNFIKDGKDKLAAKALNTIGKKMVETHLSGIIQLEEVRVENMRPVLYFRLEGVPDKLLTAEVGHIDISDDGRTVSVGKYSSNTAFVENALNRFATLTFDVPESASTGLLLAKKFLL